MNNQKTNTILHSNIELENEKRNATVNSYYFSLLILRFNTTFRNEQAPFVRVQNKLGIILNMYLFFILFYQEWAISSTYSRRQ